MTPNNPNNFNELLANDTSPVHVRVSVAKESDSLSPLPLPPTAAPSPAVKMETLVDFATETVIPSSDAALQQEQQLQKQKQQEQKKKESERFAQSVGLRAAVSARGETWA